MIAIVFIPSTRNDVENGANRSQIRNQLVYVHGKQVGDSSFDVELPVIDCETDYGCLMQNRVVVFFLPRRHEADAKFTEKNT